MFHKMKQQAKEKFDQTFHKDKYKEMVARLPYSSTTSPSKAMISRKTLSTANQW